MNHSGPAPTKREAARIVAAKEGPCMACLVLQEAGDISEEMVVVGCDYQHMTRGGIRMGHRWGYALCIWHHRGRLWGQWTHRKLRATYGPALSEGSKPFYLRFGSDEQLLARQDALLGWTDQGREAA
jgi:hypothetical protein